MNEGIQPFSLEEIRRRYGEKTPQRRYLFGRLETLLRLLTETEQLRRFYLFGSFTSMKPFPNDLDSLAVMAAGFTTEHLTPPTLESFGTMSVNFRIKPTCSG